MAEQNERIGDLYVATSPSGRSYVGLTICGVVARWRGHVKQARRGVRSPLNSAIIAYGGKSFRLEVIARGNWEQLNLWEAEQIIARGTRWPNGYNLRAGGSQYSPHPESIAKQVAKMRGRKYSAERLAAHKIAMSRPEVRARMSAARDGFVHSEETKRRMRAAHKGRMPAPHTRAAARLARLGSRHTEEAKAKMSAGVRASWLRRKILNG